MDYSHKAEKFENTVQIGRTNALDQAYETFLKNEIARWIKIEEDIGLDVLVHGEFERNDMVEFFGIKITRFLSN